VSFPADLCYVLRTVQILRGMSGGLGVDFDLTQVWAPMAEEFLKREAAVKKGRTSVGREDEDVLDLSRAVTL